MIAVFPCKVFWLHLDPIKYIKYVRIPQVRHKSSRGEVPALYASIARKNNKVLLWNNGIQIKKFFFFSLSSLWMSANSFDFKTVLTIDAKKKDTY